jgi:hypothetical protein
MDWPWKVEVAEEVLLPTFHQQMRMSSVVSPRLVAQVLETFSDS